VNPLRRMFVSSGTKAQILFESIFSDFEKIEYSQPTNYIETFWTKFKEEYPKLDGNLNGKVFETLLGTLLYREGIIPFYMQAKVAFVPNVEYDFLMFTDKRHPITLSAKTSLRERYKQADLEASVIKNVFRNAKCYLLTFDLDESNRVNKKAIDGDLVGLDECIYVLDDRLNELIKELASNAYIQPGKVDLVNPSLTIR